MNKYTDISVTIQGVEDVTLFSGCVWELWEQYKDDRRIDQMVKDDVAKNDYSSFVDYLNDFEEICEITIRPCTSCGNPTKDSKGKVCMDEDCESHDFGMERDHGREDRYLDSMWEDRHEMACGGYEGDY
jgi:hypothetical protein